MGNIVFAIYKDWTETVIYIFRAKQTCQIFSNFIQELFDGKKMACKIANKIVMA